MDSSIYEKLNKISDLEDRAVLKKIMTSVFASLEEYTKESYDNIEKRVFNELQIEKDKYDVYSCICPLEEVDPISDFFYPMVSEDLEKPEYEIKDIINALENNEELFLFKVFLDCDYLKCQEIIENGELLRGTIRTNKRIHEAYFNLGINNQYKDKIEELYKYTIMNNIRWKTQNIPYAYKMMNVSLVRCIDEVNHDEVIEEIDVDFGEYDEYVRYNMVPLWNIKEEILQVNGFPVPCKDKVNWEYNILLEDSDRDAYIIKLNDNSRNAISFYNNKIGIITSDSDMTKWNVLKIIEYNEEEVKKYKYPIASNAVDDSYVNKVAWKSSYRIKTRTELNRIVNSFVDSKKLKLVNVTLNEEGLENKETYDANFFIIDELREEVTNRYMIFDFSPVDEANILNRDILSFIMSEIQYIYPEYKCEGRLI